MQRDIGANKPVNVLDRAQTVALKALTLTAICIPRPHLQLSTSGKAMSGTCVQSKSSTARTVVITRVQAAGTQTLRSGTQKLGGTQRIGGTRKITTIEVFTKEKAFRNKVDGARPLPKLLTRVQELRLLSKLEQAGLLSLLEKNGVTLTAIEKSGALTLAEKYGLVSAAADRSTPSALFTLATVLLAAGPALVYFVPDSNPALIAAQAVGALACVVGGSAAYGGASLLSTLQK